MLQNVAETLQENARKELEEVTGKSVISKKNSKNPELLDE